jgi:glycosyltransferase involved in cell wall biosynthesis
MQVDVVVPTTRPSIIDLVMSLSLGTLVPDNILAVGNEQRPHWPGVATVTFSSDTQPIGRGDAGLRRNIGADVSDADIVVFLDDDLIAPRDMLEKTVEIVERDGFCWGHHRFLDFTSLRERNDLSSLLDKPPGEGRSREAYVNDWHGWQSSYAGLLGIRRDLFWEVGGFDLAFLGHHGNEDQHLGRRLSLRGDHPERTFVHEPPFAWHPELDRFHGNVKTNTATNGHAFVKIETINGQRFAVCGECPYRKPLDPREIAMFNGVIIPYSRSEFTLEKEST